MATRMRVTPAWSVISTRSGGRDGGADPPAAVLAGPALESPPGLLDALAQAPHAAARRVRRRAGARAAVVDDGEHELAGRPFEVHPARRGRIGVLQRVRERLLHHPVHRERGTGADGTHGAR